MTREGFYLDAYKPLWDGVLLSYFSSISIKHFLKKSSILRHCLPLVSLGIVFWKKKRSKALNWDHKLIFLYISTSDRKPRRYVLICIRFVVIYVCKEVCT